MYEFLGEIEECQEGQENFKQNESDTNQANVILRAKVSKEGTGYFNMVYEETTGQVNRLIESILSKKPQKPKQN